MKDKKEQITLFHSWDTLLSDTKICLGHSVTHQDTAEDYKRRTSKCCGIRTQTRSCSSQNYSEILPMPLTRGYIFFYSANTSWSHFDSRPWKEAVEYLKIPTSQEKCSSISTHSHLQMSVSELHSTDIYSQEQRTDCQVHVSSTLPAPMWHLAQGIPEEEFWVIPVSPYRKAEYKRKDWKKFLLKSAASGTVLQPG